MVLSGTAISAIGEGFPLLFRVNLLEDLTDKTPTELRDRDNSRKFDLTPFRARFARVRATGSRAEPQFSGLRCSLIVYVNPGAQNQEVASDAVAGQAPDRCPGRNHMRHQQKLWRRWISVILDVGWYLGVTSVEDTPTRSLTESVDAD